MTPPLTIEQSNAYFRALYSVVADNKTITFTAMGRFQTLQTLQASYKVSSAALISAYNPYSQATDAAINLANQQRLIAEISGHWATLPGAGADPEGTWVTEPCLLILGIGLEEALALGRDYDQHAIIYIDADGYTSLKACDPVNQSILTPFTNMKKRLQQGSDLPEQSPDQLQLISLTQRPPKKLLYRIIPHNNGIVFAPPDIATDIARIHVAINVSETWGEFKRRAPEVEYDDLVERIFYENELPAPEVDAPFCGETLPGWTAGDYPPRLQHEMDRYVPAEVLEQYGQRKQEDNGKGFWLISEENLAAVCAALINLGWELECAQDLPFR